MSLYHASIPPMRKMLGNIDRWLDAAVEFAKKKNFDPETLLQARLAPDQFALARQVQSACDTAKFTAARLTGKEAPSHPDTEKTIAELKERIRSVSNWLESFTEADFNGAEARKPSAPWMGGKWMHASEYLHDYALLNFLFHVTTAYAILRHNGVDLGKRDFIGSVNLHD